MRFYHARIASKVPEQEGGYFSDTSLRQLYEQAIGTPVRPDFQSEGAVGYVRAVGHALEEGWVQVVVEGNDDLAGLFAVPQIVFDPTEQVLSEDGSVREYRSIRLVSLGLTRTPADPTLTPLTSKGDALDG